MFAHHRQSLPEADQAVEVQHVPQRSPALVIDVLLAAPVVLADGHDVPALVGADPDVGPGWWNGQLDDAGLDRGVGQRAVAGIAIAEAAALSAAVNAGLFAGDV